MNNPQYARSTLTHFDIGLGAFKIFARGSRGGNHQLVLD